MAENEQNNIIIYTSTDGKASVALFERDGSVWLNQKQLAEIFDTSISNISLHIQNILKDKELKSKSVIKDYLTTASDGKEYEVSFYTLEMILAIGYRVRSKRGVQFRQWATRNLAEYMRKGFIMDDERLKNPDGRSDYFDELLARIRDIRSSEKRFYQKVRDLFSLSSDYDSTDKATQMFFAEAQNKLLFAVTRKTAAELILSRADARKLNMGLTNWKGSKVRKQDITIAKNYLSADELDSLNRLVVIFLEQAELRVKNQQDLTMGYWQSNLDKLLIFNEFPVLKTAGKISHSVMEKKVRAHYVAYDNLRKREEALEADRMEIEELKALAEKIKNKSK
ncbi:MAG: virulence RhuM family protein [Leeuwenhoekiella sp.]|uniref:virulence RhuM family protein n=1 Tax=Leeuwenhoekiella TaxID=283735 RepID=UPI000C69936B|nr:virulence RhuM family protein [Leeuwenhoekiella blandensis]MBQ52842.1 hydroxyacid dehydrogenase [Leeuwenhoekiella sp.]HCW63300.1 hydroxyacid dehydrogenase [Leeuwenhoekiella sp.]|tara:strand:+ start:3616 stop:4629 length:1014 start_codon:yes stop_codon:yes gene_type:complete